MTPSFITQEIVDQLIRHEGISLKAYLCPADNITIGVGRNLEGKGITMSEAIILLHNDINECGKDLETLFPFFREISEVRRNALIDLRFNVGGTRFRRFKKLIRAVEAENWIEAAEQMRRSRWHWQVGRRAERLEYMVEHDKCPIF